MGAWVTDKPAFKITNPVDSETLTWDSSLRAFINSAGVTGDSLNVRVIISDSATIDTLTAKTGIIQTDSTQTNTNMINLNIPDNAVAGTEYKFNFTANDTLVVLSILAKADDSGGILDGSVRIINNDLVASSLDSGIIASTTQTQGQGQLYSTVNEISIVANDNDTVTLPAADTSNSLSVIVMNNDASEILQVFPAVGDDVGSGVNISISIAPGSSARFTSYDDTNWHID